jgi:hypothetical protein
MAGVCKETDPRYKNKWKARYIERGRVYTVGRYKTKDDAIKARAEFIESLKSEVKKMHESCLGKK